MDLLVLDAQDEAQAAGGIERAGPSGPSGGTPLEWADTDRLRLSWDPNRDPKLPETGRVSTTVERTTDPLAP